PYSVEVLRAGYSSDERSACTITLVSGANQHILIDTGGPWEADLLTNLLTARGLSASSISMVICTHGHVDHIGNLAMFSTGCPNKLMIVGCDIAQSPDRFLAHDFRSGIAYELDEFVRIVHTPGHSSDDVTVLVRTSSGPLFEAMKAEGESEITVAVAGDLFESEADFNADGDAQWMSRSANSEVQTDQRKRILHKSQAVVPGHGPAFRVKPEFQRSVSVEEM
ncbi:hypothetical protein BOX15_Mlig022574g1, partial [Macrostomum lignano]